MSDGVIRGSEETDPLAELTALIDERIEMARKAAARDLTTQIAGIRLDPRAFEEAYTDLMRKQLRRR